MGPETLVITRYRRTLARRSGVGNRYPLFSRSARIGQSAEGEAVVSTARCGPYLGDTPYLSGRVSCLEPVE